MAPSFSAYAANDGAFFAFFKKILYFFKKIITQVRKKWYYISRGGNKAFPFTP